MINFVDREPTQPGRRKITHEDGTSEYVTISMADNPDVAGTPLNRLNMMAVQGFEAGTITIGKSNGVTTITNKNGNNEITTTKISKANDVTNIQVKFVGNNGMTISSNTNITRVNGVITITKEVGM